LEYLAPKTLEEACSLLTRHKEKARVLAGGTDLLPEIKRRELAAQYLIGLKGIPGLDYISYAPSQGLRIGALATLGAIADSSVVQERFDILAQAVRSMASPQIRNLGTVVGNLCHAAPSADTAPPLIALGANLRLVSPRGERVVPVEDFFIGPSQTVLQDDELVAELQIPEPPPHSGGVYLKLTRRRAMDLALVGVAALLTLEGGMCRDVRIALGAVAPTPIRATRAEDMLRRKRLEEGLLEEAARLAGEEARPISDIRSSAEYRREMVRVLTRRSLEGAREKADRA
jgi:carbon-monoxide dehydrogenase medium subunit